MKLEAELLLSEDIRNRQRISLRPTLWFSIQRATDSNWLKMLLNSCDSSRLYHAQETCKLHQLNSNSYSGQSRPLGSAQYDQQLAFQAQASNVDIYPAENYGLLQSQDGARYFQNMLHDACNKDDHWKSHEHRQTITEGYQTSPTCNARPTHHHQPSLAISHLQGIRNVPGYENSAGEMADYVYSSNAYQTIQSPQLRDKSEEMSFLSSLSSSGQRIVSMDNQALPHLPLFNQRHCDKRSGRDDGPMCNEANLSSFLNCRSSSNLMQRPVISDNSVYTASGSNRSPQTNIKVERAFVSSLFRKTEEKKSDPTNLGYPSEDVVRMYSSTSPSTDTHQRKSAKSTGRSLYYIT